MSTAPAPSGSQSIRALFTLLVDWIYVPVLLEMFVHFRDVYTQGQLWTPTTLFKLGVLAVYATDSINRVAFLKPFVTPTRQTMDVTAGLSLAAAFWLSTGRPGLALAVPVIAVFEGFMYYDRAASSDPPEFTLAVTIVDLLMASTYGALAIIAAAETGRMTWAIAK